MKYVCVKCISDEDLKEWIRDIDHRGGCDFCGSKRRKIVDVEELATYMRHCIEKRWGRAVDQLPYESREGGYLGTTWDTLEILFDEIGLELPNDNDDSLQYALYWGIGDEVWCEYDWLRLDDDVALKMSWDRFCAIVKHERRFFFHLVRQPHDPWEDNQILDPADMLEYIYQEIVESNLIHTYEAGAVVFRARPHDGTKQYASAAELGPPPRHLALQTNRMNPPGVPMMYAAETAEAAIAEVRNDRASVGQFRLARELKVIDLTNIKVPGIFSNATRNEILSRKFLKYFVNSITLPVARDERVHLDYLPTQVVTEFFRTKQHDTNPIFGIRYPSSLDTSFRNVVLFVTQEDLHPTDDEAHPLLTLDGASEYPARRRVSRSKRANG